MAAVDSNTVMTHKRLEAAEKSECGDRRCTFSQSYLEQFTGAIKCLAQICHFVGASI
jgi:hypothetical protein